MLQNYIETNDEAIKFGTKLLFLIVNYKLINWITKKLLLSSKFC